MAIPPRIIQTQRNETIGARQRATWKRHHPDFEYLFFDDAACLRLMEQHFPSLVPTYHRLPLPVQKADFFRYAAIYQGGGIYADVDTVCLAPVSSYLDMEGSNLVAGVEMSPEDFRGNLQQYASDYCLPFQLVQWAFAAPPRHPVLGRLLQRIQFLVAQCSDAQLARYSTLLRFTLELTGPILFTQVVMELRRSVRVRA
jgi:alpha 1,6-mannosyltransferase